MEVTPLLEAIIHGIVLAFGLILPLGVQNVFVFNQGASQSTFLKTLPVILTASICDSILITIAVMGISLIVLTFAWLKTLIFAIGFAFLLYMGWVIWKSKGSSVSDSAKGFSIKQQITFAASVSLLNPHAILDTIGVIGTNSLQYAGDEKFAFTLATIFVSWIWFIGLAIAGRVLRRVDQTGRFLILINKISAIIIWGVAVYMLFQLI